MRPKHMLGAGELFVRAVAVDQKDADADADAHWDAENDGEFDSGGEAGRRGRCVCYSQTRGVRGRIRRGVMYTGRLVASRLSAVCVVQRKGCSWPVCWVGPAVYIR